MLGGGRGDSDGELSTIQSTSIATFRSSPSHSEGRGTSNAPDEYSLESSESASRRTCSYVSNPFEPSGKYASSSIRRIHGSKAYFSCVAIASEEISQSKLMKSSVWCRFSDIFPLRSPLGPLDREAV